MNLRTAIAGFRNCPPIISYCATPVFGEAPGKKDPAILRRLQNRCRCGRISRLRKKGGSIGCQARGTAAAPAAADLSRIVSPPCAVRRSSADRPLCAAPLRRQGRQARIGCRRSSGPPPEGSLSSVRVRSRPSISRPTPAQIQARQCRRPP